MSGVLLRSGTLQEFRVLGVDGQPAYRSALQLREAIRLKIGREASDCLAIPQPSENGERFDWYAPQEGDVIPWSAASEAERASALAQLEGLHEKLLATADSMGEDTQNREKQLFGRLLKTTRNFPGSEHVYLVGGKPVLTFWGFTDLAGRNEYDPLCCLRPASVPSGESAALSSPSEPARAAPSAVPVAAGGSRWWRWLWLLLLPLLLLPLFFLLRGCAPSLGLDLPGLPKADVSARVGLPDIKLPARATPEIAGTGPLGQLPAGGVPEGKTAEAIAPGDLPQERSAAQEPPPAQTEAPPEPEGKAAVPPEPPGQNPPDPVNSPDPATPPDPVNSPNPVTPPDTANPSDPATPPDPGVPPPELGIPAEALKNGSVDFLNGRWKAGGGIQDAQTGKPLRLDYEFQDGKGSVRVRRGDGTECSGPVTAEMRGGGLAINSQGQVRCNDGGSYSLPEIACTPGRQSAADCRGTYQNQKFPLSMRQDIP